MGRPPWRRSPATLRIAVLLLQTVSSALSRRHVVYWNSTNTRLIQGDYTIHVDLNDYLDIYCPHYPSGSPTQSPVEILTLYQVLEEHFRGCVETKRAIKRWECNRPHAPFGPVRFSEKIQKFSPFSVGLEFRPGHHYYYSSLSGTGGPPLPCLKLRVSVCCESGAEPTQSAVHSRSAAPGSLSSLFPLFLLLFLSAI
ncbi:ephrin-A2-like isoform X1 [Paramormyrops kingsleyae]|uniref:Ephrin-A2-like n=1 Tax=Paramormyrops kingsleyae TaxID=1676925 RepID=A0A3B3RD32_9TELE|nr:ephrin-A2-like isoform X1 [Paramormyrops kingsleyae]